MVRKEQLNPPAIVEQMKVQSEKTWEDMVAMGIEARVAKDNSQFNLGDLACEVCAYSWGGNTAREHTIKQYAIGIGMNIKLLQEYSRIARIFPKDLRVPILSFRHHQLVSKLPDAIDWLHRAADNNWTCEVLMMEIKKATGKDTSDPDENEADGNDGDGEGVEQDENFLKHVRVIKLKDFTDTESGEIFEIPEATFYLVISNSNDIDISRINSKTSFGKLIYMIKKRIIKTKNVE